MPTRVIWARIIERSARQFMVIVSSGSATGTASLGELMTANTATSEEAEAARDRLIAVVEARVLARGSRVAQIERVSTPLLKCA